MTISGWIVFVFIALGIGSVGTFIAAGCMDKLERTINVYTANGDLIATYSGRIDIDTNDGEYVKFDFEGKRYIYYNCFVESIAEIG